MLCCWKEFRNDLLLFIGTYTDIQTDKHGEEINKITIVCFLKF